MLTFNYLTEMQMLLEQYQPRHTEYSFCTYFIKSTKKFLIQKIIVFFSQLCRNRDERECLTNFGFNVTTMSENVVFDSNMMMNVTRTLNYLDVVPTPLRLSSLYYKIYVLASNSLFASLIPFASLIYMNFCTVIGKYHFEICYNCTMLQKLSKCEVKA